MAKIFRISFYIVGAIIGAGFASGKEIIVFFKESGLNYLSVFYVALLIFGFCLVFLSVGSKINSTSIVKVNQALGGKLSNLFNLLTVFNCVIVLSAMLGGVNEIGSQIFKSGVVCSVAIALLSGVMVYSGRKSMQVGGW